LRYAPDYITAQEQADLLAIIDCQPWITDLKRRVQHYGYRYDYKSRSVDPSMFLGPLPDWVAALAGRLHAEGFAPKRLDQLIVNEYQPGQGIASHVDCIPCFGNTILSLSLGSPCVMVLTEILTEVQIPLLMEPCSLVSMTGESRYQWKHGIPARKIDHFQGREIQRGRRLSLTFRSVIR
jgi:alkylated DNA repair dioxygenase AlkB